MLGTAVNLERVEKISSQFRVFKVIPAILNRRQGWLLFKNMQIVQSVDFNRGIRTGAENEKNKLYILFEYTRIILQANS